ncbi:8096_t:CDS:1, partial [Scutellospora calospora]
RVCYSSIILGCKIREQLYKNLSDFVDFQYKAKNVFKQGFSDSFKLKAKSKENINDDIYINFHNYNIDFLLVHLRDTLHSMRDDETCMDEILRRIKEFLSSLIYISPQAASAASGNIPNALSVAEILPKLAKVFHFKYPITYWYPTWRGLLLIHYLLENLSKDELHGILRFYNETYLFELLWQYVFDLSISQIDQKEILNNQNEVIGFLNLWIKKEPTAPPNSLWFGVLDLAQSLSQKTSQLASLALCYYLGLESLQKSK